MLGLDSIRRAFRPIGKKRHAESNQLINDLHNATQAVEAERSLIHQDRVTAEMRHFLEIGLTPAQIFDRKRESRCADD